MLKLILAILIGINLIFSKLHAQDISINDIVYRDGYLFENQEKNKFVLSYKYHTGQNNLSAFRKIDFDTLLNVTDTTQITLSCDAKMTSMATCGEVTTYLFTTSHFFNSENDEVVAYFSNSTTNKTSFTVLSSDWDIRQNAYVKSVLNGDAFLFYLGGTS